MRILVANANTTEAITARCADAARAAAGAGTEIVPGTPRFGPAVISSGLENAIAAHGLLDLLAGHAGQVDAVVLAVSLDTALQAARQLMPCPVVGMTEAACLTACMLGNRFGLVTFGHTESYRQLIEGYGLSARLSGLVGVDSTPQRALTDPEGALRAVAEGVAELVAGGADSVVLGGAALAGMEPSLRQASPVPLLDGMICGVRMAEALVALAPPKPRHGPMAPVRGRESAGLSPALAALLRGGS
ncbi:aspartate/glutamate racemase family protein [Roseomonas xinghualingensis]|uniref:aspartate/glutamate racemase family protein n=1 Tax=Roseomonas xinghualingensis TaxID=2986475 RepID=UPI0021F19595|nr:aspartate/glutamate racemase family protein [Roseomonas sp. SXEYE001]MCV4209062.1 aspartate/glutamate racemase family protein [Roseomonas sp. SXEYE001]